MRKLDIKCSDEAAHALQRVSKEDINSYANDYGMADLYGSRLEMIEQIRDHITGKTRNF